MRVWHVALGALLAGQVIACDTGPVTWPLWPDGGAATGDAVAEASGSDVADGASAPSSPLGACLVLDDRTALPPASAPSVGAGYVRQGVPGATTAGELLVACTDVYAELEAAWCRSGSALPAHRVVVVYREDGGPDVALCADGCLPVACSASSGACLLRGSAASLPERDAASEASDLVMRVMPAAATSARLAEACTDKVWESLDAAHCAQSDPPPVRHELVLFDADGHPVASACADAECTYRRCPEDAPPAVAACLVRAVDAAPPPAEAPDEGPGYVRLALPSGAPESVAAACTPLRFEGLLAAYWAAGNAAPALLELVRYDEAGAATTCAKPACTAVERPSYPPTAPVPVAGACALEGVGGHGGFGQGTPHVGFGFAKEDVAATDLRAVQRACPPEAFGRLEAAYCAAGNTGFARLTVVLYDAWGRPLLRSCPRDGCVFATCPEA